MTPENFCYWLTGYFELSNSYNLNRTQIKIIKDHLNLVNKKVTPDRHIEELYNEPNTCFSQQTVKDTISVGNSCFDTLTLICNNIDKQTIKWNDGGGGGVC